jgi:hypothetical protein
MEPVRQYSLRRRSVKPIEFEEVTYYSSPDDGGQTDQDTAAIHTTTTVRANKESADRTWSPTTANGLDKMNDFIVVNTIMLRQFIRNAMAAVFVVLFLHVLRSAASSSSTEIELGGLRGR